MIGLIIPTGSQFNFRRTVLSHGWYMLAPLSWDADSGVLSTVYQTGDGTVLRLRMSAEEDGVAVRLPDCQELTPVLEAEVTGAVKTILNLDWDLSAFYNAMGAHEGYAWLEAERSGRILVSPSLWEDLAKVLLTTNCTWSQTINMSRQLCQLGAPHPTIDGCHAFPTPQRIASMSLDELADALRAGYRNAYLHDLAQRICSAEVDLDCWLTLDSDDLFNAVKSLRGFGDYAAGTILRMLGHFDRVAIDTAAHSMYADQHNGGVKGSAVDIKAHYATFGKWQGLVMWMDIMRRNDA